MCAVELVEINEKFAHVLRNTGKTLVECYEVKVGECFGDEGITRV